LNKKIHTEVRLKAANIWDTEKANEELGTEEVTGRVLEEEKKNQLMMQQQMNQQPKDEDSTMQDIKQADRPPMKSATASLSLRTGYLEKKDKMLGIILKRLEQKNS